MGNTANGVEFYNSYENGICASVVDTCDGCGKPGNFSVSQDGLGLCGSCYWG